MLHSRVALVLAASLFCGCSGSSSFAPVAPVADAAARSGAAKYAARNDLPPRLQWLANYGYCGETSMIGAGLYFGQYASQYEVRAIASPGVPQYNINSQLLVGGNAAYAALQMHLQPIPFNTAAERSTHGFLRWIKRNVALGLPVIIGVYENQRRFNQPGSGDPQYDHIGTIVGVSSAHPLADDRYYAGDTLTFSDNGLWGIGRKHPYFFTYAFGPFQQSRKGANSPKSPIYSIADDAQNFGVAIAGAIDRDRETLPVRVATNVNYEEPVMVRGGKRPRPMPLVLTITVSGLRPGVAYVLYRYDRFSDVPNEAFNAAAARAAKSWQIKIASGSTYTLRERIMSDDVRVYRAVAASSP